jgi:hypothetical protein
MWVYSASAILFWFFVAHRAQMQFVCDPEKGPCAQRIKELSADINNVTGQTPTTTPAHLLSSSDRWPLMKMCASCEKAKGIKMCAGCGVTR